MVDRRASSYTVATCSAPNTAGNARTASISVLVITTVTPDGHWSTTGRPPR
jgi:hypothetical protein